MSLASGHVNYNSIQDYQIWLHSSQKDPESPFYHEHIRVGWHSTFLENLESIIDKENKEKDSITFVANGKAHFLLYTNLVHYTPEVISPNPNIEVAWTPNLSHNYAQLAELKFNDILAQKFDTVGADILIQLDPRPGEGKRKQYLRDIGNISSLTNFSRQLPPTRLSLHCPWSFSKASSKSIPLCLSTTTIVTLKFKIQRDPSKLIRIREKHNDQFHLRALDYEDPIIIRGLENSLLPFPQLSGKYALVTPREIRWQKKIPDRELFYDTFQEFDAVNWVKHGESSHVKLSSNLPVRALFPVAQNMTASAINNHSNYTTNPYDCQLGVSAISNYNLYYSTVKILDNINSDVFSNDEPYWNCSACPESPGYAAIVFSSSLQRDEDIGIVPSSVGGKLSVEIDENRGSRSASFTSDYHFKIRGLVTQVFKYENNMIILPRIPNSNILREKWNQWNIHG